METEEAWTKYSLNKAKALRAYMLPAPPLKLIMLLLSIKFAFDHSLKELHKAYNNHVWFLLKESEHFE